MTRKTVTSRILPAPIEVVDFTRQEIRVLLLVGRGRAPKDIALDMGISAGTARNYVYDLCRGLGLTGGRPELVVWIMQHPEAIARGICDPRPHPENCDCAAPYCSTMRIDQAA